MYIDALVLRDRDSNGDGTLDERLWVVQDANYNVTALLDNAGNVVERYVYDPFGQATVLDAGWNVLAASAFGWLYLHQGGRLDAMSGLYHFRHRDYSPTLGRWTSLDPLGYGAGDVNLYRALGNGVTNRLDPSGLADIVPGNPLPDQFVHLRRTYYLTYGWTGNTDVTITLGSVVERNGRLYVQFGGYYVLLEKVTASGDLGPGFPGGVCSVETLEFSVIVCPDFARRILWETPILKPEGPRVSTEQGELRAYDPTGTPSAVPRTDGRCRGNSGDSSIPAARRSFRTNSRS